MMVNRLLGYQNNVIIHGLFMRTTIVSDIMPSCSCHHAIMPSYHHATDANRSLPEDSNVRHVHLPGSDPVIYLIIGLGRDRS